MRIAALIALCVLIAGCSSGATDEPPADRSDSAEPSSSVSAESSPSDFAKSLDPCDLLTEEELEALAGDELSPARPGLTGGLPNCQWLATGGTFVQTIGASSSEWAQNLPEALRALEASGQFTDQMNRKKLHKAAELIESGQDVDPGQACVLFSDMAELLGQPEGSPWVVTVIPTRKNPQAVTGQMCSGGEFTSVLIGNEAGLEGPLPMKQVVQAIKVAHRKNLS